MSTEEHSATLSSKGQVVVPARVRRRLGLAQGSVLRFVIDAEGVHLRAAAGEVQRLKGRLTPPAAAVSIDDMNRALAQRRSRIAAAALPPKSTRR